MTNSFDYSVRVKNGAGWRPYNRVRLMISVGKEYHEGAKLEAVVNWINRNPSIQEVHVSVNDTLQRHNFEAAGMSKQEAAQFAKTEGALWMVRNGDILDGIKAKTIITRWDDWHGKAEFKAVQNELLSHARADACFEEAMAKDALSLAERKANRGEPVPASLVIHSQDYIEEEMAVFAMQTAALPAAEVYPGSNLLGAAYLLGKAGLPQAIRPLAQRYFTRIDFDRINVTPMPAPVAASQPQVA
jgi:tRNA-dependent cyclodipeptide synthase